MNDAAELAGSDLIEVGSFGEELPQEAIGVFIRAALPGRVWLREVDRHADPAGEVFIAGELLSIVEGECSAQPGRYRLKQFVRGSIDGFAPASFAPGGASL